MRRIVTPTRSATADQVPRKMDLITYVGNYSRLIIEDQYVHNTLHMMYDFARQEAEEKGRGAIEIIVEIPANGDRSKLRTDLYYARRTKYNRQDLMPAHGMIGKYDMRTEFVMTIIARCNGHTAMCIRRVEAQKLLNKF